MTHDAADRGVLAARLLRLCAVDSTSGQEDAILPELRALLGEAGAEILEQPVAHGRTNVLATWGRPRLLFSTHLDTVPPFIPPRADGAAVRGRGACDAKGQIVAQLAAIERLLAAGRGNLAWLGVVDEEQSSLGAKRAGELAPRLDGLRAVINGEPTQNRLATGQRGILTLRLRCSGLAAHSGTPERGRSAIWPLLDWLQALRAIPLPVDRDFGPLVWNLGLLRGGAAPNVVPAAAEAEILARTLPGVDFLEWVEARAPGGSAVEVLAETPPERFRTLPGFPAAPVPFGSDAPHLAALTPDRNVVLAGPGSIDVAHTDEEHIALDDLQAGVDLLQRVAIHLLDEGRR